MKLWNWMPYVDEDGYCQVNRPAVHLKKEGAERQLGFWHRTYPDANVQLVENTAGGWGVKIILEVGGKS